MNGMGYAIEFESIKQLKERRSAAWDRMDKLVKTAKAAERNLTPDEREQYDKYAATLDDLTRGIKTRESYAPGNPDVPEIQGTPGERLVRGQSMVEYVRRAAENGVTSQTSDGFGPQKVEYQSREQLNEYWGQRFGFAKRNTEFRALAEDGAGSGQAITPQAWTAQVIDYLYAESVAGQLGVSRITLPTEVYNVPVLTAPAQPAWLAENSTIGLDANPAFSSIQMSAKGGFKDITNYSVELSQDAYLSGGLPDFLAQSVARNMALAVDGAMIMGVAGNAGNPGLVNETGFVTRHASGDAGGGSGYTAASTAELSVVNEVVRNANAVNEGFLSNVKLQETYSRITSGGYPMFFPKPETVADIPWIATANASIVPSVETDPASATSVAQSGGTFSSLYAGPWSFVMLGVHLDLTTRTLIERYVDLGQVGLFSMMRFSVRTGNPQAFCRTIGFVAS